MKKPLLALAALAAIQFPLTSQASDGTINFTGALSDTTCTINGGQATLNVQLGTPAITGLQTSGQTTGDTPFALALTNCSGSATTALAYFEPNLNINPAGRLSNTAGAGAATNVDLQLVDASSGSVINLNGARGNQSVTGADISTGSGNANFIVRYYATGAATSGAVTSSVTYQIDYL